MLKLHLSRETARRLSLAHALMRPRFSLVTLLVTTGLLSALLATQSGTLTLSVSWTPSPTTTSEEAR